MACIDYLAYRLAAPPGYLFYRYIEISRNASPYIYSLLTSTLAVGRMTPIVQIIAKRTSTDKNVFNYTH
jgi:hypothetical protein